ncbi:MAG TPA: amidohydrolase, partial [Candidatus Acidoferrales bacterium]|nr:amidohydrolase [Candidatus Acidoferrales bacterium]
MKSVPMRAALCAAAVISLFAFPGAGQAPPAHVTADLVIVNGKVHTVDQSRPEAQALAISGERIRAVGTDRKIRAWIGPSTKVLDAHGATVLPGFNDSHVHFVDGSMLLSQVNLGDATTREEFTRRVAAYAGGLKKGEWVLGGGWDHEKFPGATLPTREWIDGVTPGNPAWLDRYDGHMGLANSAALKLAGVDRNTPDPPGGTIVRDADGNPTGALKDAAGGLIRKVIPAPSEERLTAAIRAGLNEARIVGLTSVQDISHGAEMRVYQKLLEAGELTTRFYGITPIQLYEAQVQAGITAGFGNDWIRTGALKGFADGSLGSTTALLNEPYSDAPDSHGLFNAMMLPEGHMLAMAQPADAAGLQIAVHAIGDRANHEILAIYEEIARRNGPGPARGRRWRIEHAQHLLPSDYETFARLGVIASMQPTQAIQDGTWAEKRIGHERAKSTHAWRSLLDHGVKLAFGTDWPVAPLNPLLGLYAAVTRATLDGKNPGGWIPEQRITLAEAIEAYTLGSAYAEFTDTQKGSLTPGKLADVVILDADLFAIPAEKIREAKVVATIVGGRVVYDAHRLIGIL